MLDTVSVVGLCIFWGLIGLVIIAPLLLLSSAYQAFKTADIYHFRGYYKQKKQHHIKEARAYGTFVSLICIFVIGIFVVL